MEESQFHQPGSLISIKNNGKGGNIHIRLKDRVEIVGVRSSLTFYSFVA